MIAHINMQDDFETTNEISFICTCGITYAAYHVWCVYNNFLTVERFEISAKKV